MNAREWGIALLCCAIPGDDLAPLSLAQLHTLGQRVRAHGMPEDPAAHLRPDDLCALGYTESQAGHIYGLLSREARLERYLDGARTHGIYLLTRLSPEYPARLRAQLGTNAPPVFFAAGSAALLARPTVSLVGSRALQATGARFARQVGTLAAREGLSLVSGNAPGADRTAQYACLSAGGSVIAFVADRLLDHLPRDPDRQLFLSAGGYDWPFSTPRALARNHSIHALSEKTFVAQCSHGHGGTWDGTIENLRHGWSEVYVCDDASAASRTLTAHGATPLPPADLTSLADAVPVQCKF